MHRFFAEDIATSLTLPEEESRHASRVLRLVEGDEIEVVDGNGGLFRCHIALSHPKHTKVTIFERIEQPPHWGSKIIIAVAPTKNLDRLEWMAEKCAEMGIDRIIPVECEHSERKVLKTERIRKILVAAMKQSLKATLPRLDEMTPLESVINTPFDGNKFIAFCDMNLPRNQRLEFCKQYRPDCDTLILIGPEGDFSPREVEMAINSGFMPVTLGESRLRTETAAVFACAACHALKCNR